MQKINVGKGLLARAGRRAAPLLLALGVLGLSLLVFRERPAAADSSAVVAAGGFIVAGAAGSTHLYDDFNDTDSWWFHASVGGNGYLAPRSQSLSPPMVGVEYTHAPDGAWQALSRAMDLDALGPYAVCQAAIGIFSVTPVSGRLEIDNGDTGGVLYSRPFNHPASSSYNEITVGGDDLTPFSPSSVIFRLFLLGNGSYQELMADNLNLSCNHVHP